MAAIVTLLASGCSSAAASSILWARGAIGSQRARGRRQLALPSRATGQWEDRLKAATGDALLKSQTSLLELTEAKLAPIKETLHEVRGAGEGSSRTSALREVTGDRRAAARRSPRARRSSAPRPAAS